MKILSRRGLKNPLISLFISTLLVYQGNAAAEEQGYEKHEKNDKYEKNVESASAKLERSSVSTQVEHVESKTEETQSVAEKIVDGAIEPEEYGLPDELVEDELVEDTYEEDQFEESEWSSDAYSYSEEPDTSDPWVGYNRLMFKFNEQVDRYIIRPLAVGYKSVLPVAVQRGVQNFFFNLGEFVTIPNDLMQAKYRQASNDTARLFINSTIGLVGLFDVASKMGLERHQEDFGQTLGYWGVGNGPYLVLPFLGPSTLRDTIGLGPDYLFDPVTYVDDGAVSFGLFGVDAISFRASLLEADALINGDRYIFVKAAYVQSRAFEVNDGELEDDPFLDDEEDEEDW